VDGSTTTARARRVDAALWALTAALAVATVVLSLGVSAPGVGSFSIADELGHGAMYFATVGCLLLAAVWRPGRGDGPWPGAALAIAIGAIVVGLGVEAIQELATARRHAEVGDVAAEIVGVLAAWAIHARARRHAERPHAGRNAPWDPRR
jgi:hypothetical protein